MVSFQYTLPKQTFLAYVSLVQVCVVFSICCEITFVIYNSLCPLYNEHSGLGKNMYFLLLCNLTIWHNISKQIKKRTTFS
jgi:hypothetical protein